MQDRHVLDALTLPVLRPGSCRRGRRALRPAGLPLTRRSPKNCPTSHRAITPWMDHRSGLKWHNCANFGPFQPHSRTGRAICPTSSYFRARFGTETASKKPLRAPFSASKRFLTAERATPAGLANPPTKLTKTLDSQLLGPEFGQPPKNARFPGCPSHDVPQKPKKSRPAGLQNLVSTNSSAPRPRPLVRSAPGWPFSQSNFQNRRPQRNRTRSQLHAASGGRLIRIASTLPPVLRPNSVPRS